MPSERRRRGMWELIRSDYSEFARQRGDRGAWSSRLRFLPRMFMNPSLHAVVLVRLSQGCPRWMHWFWRNILIWKHSMDIPYDVEIGPGFFLPHPHTITMAPGVEIGARCQMLHMTTIGAGVGGERCPRLGDDVVLMLGAAVLGDLTVGDKCVVGAYAWVDSDMPPGSLAIAPKATIADGKGERVLAQIAPHVPPGR